MAEKTGGRDAAVTRRPSFRKTLKEHANSLPPEYLDALEQKRKQLDESIHKYIAAKEREYKQYEKELKQQTRHAATIAAAATATQSSGSANGNGASSAPKRRTSSESTAGSAASPFLAPQQHNAVDALMSSGLRREPLGPALLEEEELERLGPTKLKNRRTSAEREKDFVGLFTPPFLPLIDHKDARNTPARPIERTESAPPDVEPSRRDTPAEANSLNKADSETAMYAKYKRPIHLQLAKRTSSSGSSADGKLASAMKSPTQSLQRPKRKRVSLAVGDSIVAPSDNVPLAMNISSAPSHSRTRSPETERENVPTAHTGATLSLDFAKQPATASVEHIPDASSVSPSTTKDAQSVRAPVPAASTGDTSRKSIDPDGDLFDLDDELDGHAQQSDAFESAVESEEDAVPGIAGRIGTSITHAARIENTANAFNHHDAGVGLVLEATGETRPTFAQSEEEAIVSPLGPASSGFSSSSSRQPTSPGFRRPTVEADPVFRGTGYLEEEARAADEEVYGSSYSRPTKGSFTGDSLGESYMQKHAEEMMKTRVAKREQSVR